MNIISVKSEDEKVEIFKKQCANRVKSPN